MSDSVAPWIVASRLLCPWDFPGKHTGVGCYSLLQGIFPTQGLNPGLLHYRQILYCLSHQGSLCDYWTERFISKLCRTDKQIYLTNDHSSMGLTNSLQKVCKDHHSCECSWIVYCVLLCAQSCLTLCYSMDFNPPGSSVHGILQERILECVAISSSRGSSPLGDRTCVCISCVAGTFFTADNSR